MGALAVMGASDHVHGRALDELEALVGQTRPQLVDVFDTLALLESLGYTDERVAREFGLSDVRALAESLFERLGDRPLPVTAPPFAAASADAPAQSRSWLPAVVCVLAWIGAAVASRLYPQPWARQLPTMLMASVIVWMGFIEAIRRRSAFYVAVGQLRIASVVCWYFVRLAALLSVVAAAACAGAALVAGVAWPVVALAGDEFLLCCALWAVVCAMAVPGAVSWRRGASPSRIPIPRMTIVVFHELRSIVVGTIAALIAFSPRLMSDTVAMDALVAALLAAAMAVVRRGRNSAYC